MIEEHISYEDACAKVSEIKNGSAGKVFCLAVVSEDCPFCKDMMRDVIPEVIQKYKDSIELRTFDIAAQDSDYCIFPVENSPAFLFYVKGGKPFPAVRQGAAPLEEVMKEVERIIEVSNYQQYREDKGLNVTHH